MNEVFIIGKIVSKIDYRFIINSKKNNAKVEFKILVDNQVFKVIGYNGIADFCYRKLTENKIIFINGKITTNYTIEIKKIVFI